MLDISSRSVRTYMLLILTLAVLGAANVFLPQGSFMAAVPDQEMPASKPVMALATAGMVLVIHGGLGFLGLWLSRKLGFPEIWDSSVSNRQRFLIPALAGLGSGIFLIAADAIFARFRSVGPLPHPPFPTSIVASASAGIGEEVIFRLFFISFWMWLVSSVLLRGRWQTRVFWGVAVLSAVAFAMAHLPAVMLVYGWERLGNVPPVLLSEIILLNGLVSLLAAYLFRRYGFLAAVSVHFWTDVVWHVIWGLLA